MVSPNASLSPLLRRRYGPRLPRRPNDHFKIQRTSTLEKVYRSEYLPQECSPEEHRRIIGAECCVWSEYLTEHDIYRMLFPRVLAVSELMWSYPETRDYERFRKRVEESRSRWRLAGVEFGPSG
jgi:hexosaminidase